MSYQQASVGSLIIVSVKKERQTERGKSKRKGGGSGEKERELCDGGIKSVTRRGVNVSFYSFSWIR